MERSREQQTRRNHRRKPSAFRLFDHIHTMRQTVRRRTRRRGQMPFRPDTVQLGSAAALKASLLVVTRAFDEYLASGPRSPARSPRLKTPWKISRTTRLSPEDLSTTLVLYDEGCCA